GIASNSVIKVVSSVMAYSFGKTNFSLSINNFLLGEQSVEAVEDYTYSLKGVIKSDTFNTVSTLFNSSLFTVSLTFAPDYASRESKGYLDKLVLHVRRNLEYEGTPLFFSSLESTSNSSSTYEVTGLSNDAGVWDITDPLNPIGREFDVKLNALNFGAPSAMLKKYAAFELLMEFPSPLFLGQIQNQNIKDIAVPDLLIISSSEFMSAARRLAEFRAVNDHLEVEVVSVDQVYNEFSSGSKDVTAMRNYARYLYHRVDNPGKLKYVLLFGRGSFDHKDIKGYGLNFIPMYQSRNSLHPLYTYGSDDYLGLLDPGEGVWEESLQGDEDLNISVGRLPVKTLEESNIVVDKLIRYEENSILSKWKSKVLLVADDGDFNIHHSQVDQIAQYLDTTFSGINPVRLYLDNFVQEVSAGGGKRSPDMRDALNRNVQEGALIVNFTGHGNTSIWTEESILDQFMINDWENSQTMPLFVTATCDFGKHDNPLIISSGEKTMLHPSGGSIGLVSTSRPVLSSTNFLLNKAFYSNAFKTNENGYLTLGEIFRLTKNESMNGVNNRNFSLLGDPSMTLSYPSYTVDITSVNQSALSSANVISAMSYVTLQGSINDLAGQQALGFNGEVELSFYDKKQLSTTLGDESQPFSYREWKSKLFNGTASVKNGLFEIDFIVPKNILYNQGNGKISMYAWDTQSGQDAWGSTHSIMVGGTSKGIVNDNLSPEAEVFINDTTFINGGITPPDVKLLVYLFDENGINISSTGIGQDIEATLDGKKKFILNDFYTANKDDFTSGKISFPMYDLSEGKHFITIKAWDTYNNSVEKSVDFIVVDDRYLKLSMINGSPNPFHHETKISFEHNRPGDDLEVMLSIYNSLGMEILRDSKVVYDSPSRVTFEPWNGYSKEGLKVNQGIYFVAVTVRSLADGAKNKGVCKLIYIN
ncbi:MAG: type IX secretion system sortase PorU, partial [Cyclobacteriaceae bacterium]|nr:type IX secretion system sortase PorU [Cyclobacteriaceae bacterium]